MEDTQQEQKRFLYRLLQTLSPEVRVMRLCRLNSVISKYPNASLEELRVHFAGQLRGKEFAEKIARENDF